MENRPSEKGQALILIVLAIVGIFGFAALAVDGSRYFAERRRAQNAADAAAYAAAFAGVNGDDWSAAGIASTRLNGYNDTDPIENVGAIEDVRVHHPPVRGRYSTTSESIKLSEYYQVILRIRVDKVFSQFVFPGDLWVEVEATTRATAQRGFPSGAAIVSTCLDCCDSLVFRGTGDIHLIGGSVVSKSTRTGSATVDTACHSAARYGEAVLDIDGGNFVASGTLYNNTDKTCKHADGTIASPCLSADNIYTNTPYTQSFQYPYTPDCSALPTISKSTYDKTGTISGGYYPGGIKVTGSKTVLTLNPGMYCLDGDLSVESGSLIGSDVMFFMRKGSVTIVTNSPVNLSAPLGAANAIDDPKLGPDFWSGFLIFMPSNNTGIVYMAGGGSTSYTGTIYAPGELNPNPFDLAGHGKFPHKCTIQGSSVETAMNASIICHTVSIAGGNSFSLVYDDKLNAQSPGSIELSE